MIHKILMWISIVAGIAGIAVLIVEKLGVNLKKIIPLNITYIIIFLGIIFSIVLAVTENNTKTNDAGEINAINYEGKQNIITNPQNKGDIIFGDDTTSAEKRYQSAYNLVKDELILNFISLAVLIEGIESSKPEKFWDIRKPNESEDTYQERAERSHSDYQSFIFQIVQSFSLKEDVYNSHQLYLSHNSTIANKIKKVYQYQKQLIDDFNAYSQGLLHNLSLSYSDTELTAKNLSLHAEKIINARISFLNALLYFVQVDPTQISNLKETLQIINIEFQAASSEEIIKEILVTISALSDEKAKIFAERIKMPERDEEINRLITDPYLLMLRKTVGLSDTLSESEAWALKHKKIQTDITESTKLLSAAAYSYLESDGNAAKYYFEKALSNDDYSPTMRLFIEKSLDRLNSPDMFDGSIGLIILELDSESLLKDKNMQIGDILYKFNNEIVNEPSEVSSAIAKTNKDDNCLLEFYTLNGEIRRVAVPGSTPLHCKLSQLICLNLYQA